MAGLKDKYCIVGVGETGYTRHSGRSTRSMGAEAVRRAVTDAGLHPDDVNGMLSYHANDSTTSLALSQDLGMRLDFYMDCSGGGSSTEALVGLACGAIEAGMCHTVAIFRSMNGYCEARMGGSPAASRPAGPVVAGAALETLPYGHSSPGSDVPVHVRAAHVRIRDDQRAAGPGEGGAQPARVKQSEGLLQDPRDGRRCIELPVDRETGLPPARLLRRDGQRHLHHRHLSRSGPAHADSARSTSCRWPGGSTSPSAPCTISARLSPAKPATTPSGSCSATRAWSLRTSS